MLPGPDLVETLANLLRAITDREEKKLVERQGMTPGQIYEALTEARTLRRRLGPL
jgi:hypothetical protein